MEGTILKLFCLSFENRSTLKENNYWSKFFPFKIDPFSEGQYSTLEIFIYIFFRDAENMYTWNILNDPHIYLSYLTTYLADDSVKVKRMGTVFSDKLEFAQNRI